MNRVGVRVALAVESRVFPLAFGILAARGLWGILAPLPHPQFGKGTLLEAAGVLAGYVLDPSGVPAPLGLTRAQMLSMLALGVVHPILGFVFNATCGLLLALRARLQYVPSSWREILIPTAATFLLLLVSLSDRVPAWLTRPFPVPPGWTIPLLSVSAGLTLGGLGLALWGLAHLRRSFSVFVEVRRIVTTGPYRWIRHPLYLGEVAMAAGLWLSRPATFGLLLVAVLLALQLARIDMEEARLSAASPEYAARMRVTGRLFPRLGFGVRRG